MDVPALERSLRSLQGEKRNMDDSVNALQQEMTRISMQSSARGALEAHRKEKRNKEEDYQNQ